MNNVAAGVDPLRVRRGIEAAADRVVKYIHSIASEVSDRARGDDLGRRRGDR
jgi:chaperonin GroEL (HSP60 family)